MLHKCEECHKVLASKFSLERHKSKYHPAANVSDEDDHDEEEHNVSSEDEIDNTKSEKHTQKEEAAEEAKNHEQESLRE